MSAVPTSALNRIGVVGGGAWGTALALAALRAGRETLLWAREPAVVEAMSLRRENRDYLPGVPLPDALRITGDLADLGDCDAVLLVSPAQHARSVTAGMASLLKPEAPVVVCAKGIELDSHALMSEAVGAALPAGNPVAILSGPTFAAEVARGLPTAVTLACADEALGRALVTALGSHTFRPYRSDDVIGSQVGGAVKNVLAIACGVVEGRRLGDNARAALITRGLAEITRLALALGGRVETLMGLSGLGDLTLTCSSLQSRNMSLGAALGAGKALSEILAARRSVAEGVYTTAAVVGLAAKLGVDMPICTAVDAILNRGAGLDETIEGLLSRPFRGEGV
ncbi:NAD(P)H-dependent glycerol-3-phosphate dehydrogenase [Azospirillum sp. TSO5]|uniref:NAD(P)H-dependent glycerol-3-phosphate dehydrogenase n=1 Tax=Azospirillum sp. TSO5 TaxID=716760 RepID=UPI000D61F7B1|nr:NAD(P)H-dependent glycerol-3-phosphate dehydrogenase [Azospirillum sp. TSO5]PWC83873.1 glycerol-3-phosphate acyltransferase [Azospirillum sp. TSO5]